MSDANRDRSRGRGPWPGVVRRLRRGSAADPAADDADASAGNGESSPAPDTGRQQKREPRQQRPPSPALLARAADPDARSGALWLVALRGLRAPTVSRALAANPAAPRSLLWWLARLGRWDVGVAVARNPNCGMRVLRYHAFSPTWAVQAAVASNVRARLDVITRLAGSYDARVAIAAAGNLSLAPSMVAALLRSPDIYVRGVAAAHPNAPPDELRRLAEGMSEPAWVLRAIAANPSCPAELSDQLLTWIALGGAGKQDPLFDPVTCKGHPASTDGAAFAWYTEAAKRGDAERHPLWRVRAAVAPARKQLPLATVRQLRRDARPEVRRTVAGFIGVRPREVREMMGDADPIAARIATQVRSANRKRYWKIHSPRWRRRALRLAPAALLFCLPVVSGLFQGSGRSGGSSTPTAQCASTVRWLGAARPTATLTHRPATALGGLPGGGWLACGPTAGEPHAVLLTAGSTTLGFIVPATVLLPNGQEYSDLPLQVAAGHAGLFYLPQSPQQVVIAIYPRNRQSDAVLVTVSFAEPAQ